MLRLVADGAGHAHRSATTRSGNPPSPGDARRTRDVRTGMLSIPRDGHATVSDYVYVSSKELPRPRPGKVALTQDRASLGRG